MKMMATLQYCLLLIQIKMSKPFHVLYTDYALISRSLDLTYRGLQVALQAMKLI